MPSLKQSDQVELSALIEINTENTKSITQLISGNLALTQSNLALTQSNQALTEANLALTKTITKLTDNYTISLEIMQKKFDGQEPQ